MTTIWDVYEFIRGLTDKAGIGFVRPDDVSKWLEAAQLQLFNDYRELGALDNNTQSLLAPFVKDPVASFTSSAAGHFAKPGDFVQALRVVNNAGKEHTPILHNEVRDAVVSAIEPIADYPRYQEAGNYIVLYPMQVTSGTLEYYRLPTPPVIGYTSDSSGNPVYSSGASTQLEIPPAYYLKVIIKALPYVGVNLSDADVYALANAKP